MSASKTSDVDPFQAFGDPDEESQHKQRHGAAFEGLFGSASGGIERVKGFGLDELPLVSELSELPGEVLTAQTTVPLVREQIGSRVVVLFELGDVRRPIVIGVLEKLDSSEAVKRHGAAV